MANDGMRSVLNRLQRAMVREQGAGDDAQLLEAFFQEGSEIALEALLRRHGPMVMGVCLRVLHDGHDAEDAFQATFLVLARKGRTLRKMQLVGNWLYGVAHRCALHIRSANLRRRANERQVVDMPEPAVREDNVGFDLRPLLDREIERLPEKYRVPLVLCDLEGRQRREVAQQLGLAEGTLSSRLATARRMLAKRLSSRGVTLSGGLLAVVLAEQARAAVPAAVAQATFQAAAKLATGQALASLGVSGGVLAAFHGVMRTMLYAKLKVFLGCLLAIGLAAGILGVTLADGGFSSPRAKDPPAGAQGAGKNEQDADKENAFATHLQSRSWTLKKLDQDNRTITICDRPLPAGGFQITFDNPTPPTKPPDQKGVRLEGLQLAKQVKVWIDGRSAKVADLKEGMTLILKILADKPQIAEIQVINKAREDRYFVAAVHLKKNSVVLRVNNTTVEMPLSKNARLVVASIRPGTNLPQTSEGPVIELEPGTPVHLQVAVENERLVIRVLTVSQ